MKDVLAVFGFGSFFRRAENARDIDLLLIHRSNDLASCRLAIECKQLFQRSLSGVDVVMLSKSESEQNQFVARSGAIALGFIDSENCKTQVLELVERIRCNSFR